MAVYRNTSRIGRDLLGWSAIGLALSCSACTSVSLTARPKPVAKETINAIYTEESKPTSGGSTWAKAAPKQSNSEIQQLNYAAPQVGQVRLKRDSGIQQIAYSDETAQPQFVNNQSQITAPAVTNAQWCPENSAVVEMCPPEPRWPTAGPNPMAAGLTACDACNMPSAEKFTDEYLCDGGDRDLPVHYTSVFRKGLDTEDTVLEFTDRDGMERVKATNKVCIYAPRFASVRTVSSPQEGLNTEEVGGLGHLATTGAVHTRLKASNGVKNVMTGRMASRSRASGVEGDTALGAVASRRLPSIHDKVLNIYQSMTFVQFGRLDDADTARLNYGIQAAFAWTREEYPVISSKTDMALEAHFQQSSAVITAIDEKETTENLRIVKLTDTKTAVPGDEIEFTIRYDNLGTREVHHIRIVDNLTPRLVYIDESATSDRDGRLVLQDNGEGSQILVWELDEPLPGKTGGVVTFKTRVR